MARAAKKETAVSLETVLWNCRVALRGVGSTEKNRDAVIALVFLKFAGDKFEKRRAELIAQYGEIPAFLEKASFYNAVNVFYLKETARWSYDYTDTLRDRNDVISDVLNVIDKIILFKFSNYFLKVAKAYKEIRGQDPKDNWYEFVEYGSTNKRAIAIQKHGFSRESAMYILRQGQKYIAADEPELRLHRSILECPNKGVRNDADMIQYNIPDLFVD